MNNPYANLLEVGDRVWKRLGRLGSQDITDELAVALDAAESHHLALILSGAIPSTHYVVPFSHPVPEAANGI